MAFTCSNHCNMCEDTKHCEDKKKKKNIFKLVDPKPAW